MNSKPLVSVVIPVYNAEAYIRICIEQILSQTYENLEIIFIDDGSKDKSRDICLEYAEKDNRIKVYTKEKNLAISVQGFSSFYIIIYLDSFVYVLYFT